MRAPRRVAIMAQNGLGDIVMALPMLAAIDRELPAGVPVLLLVYRASEERVVRLLPWRRPVQVLQTGTERGWRALPHLIRIALQVRRFRPDLLLTPHMIARPRSTLFAMVVGAPVSVGEEGPWRRFGFSIGIPWPDGMHKSIFYMKMAQAVGLAKPDEPLVYPELAHVDPEGALPEDGTRWVFLAPGSGPKEAHKRWPVASFAELARRLLDEAEDIRIGVFGAPGEAQLLSQLETAIAVPTRTRVVTSKDVAQSLAIMERAECVVAGCSGSLHMAALAGRPLVGLYGPTNPSVTGPLSGNVRIVRRSLACSPCYRPDFMGGCGEPVCMSAIGVEAVLAAVRDALAGRISALPADVKTTRATAPSAP